MKSIVLFILVVFMAISCGSNKRVVAPPFEEEETSATAQLANRSEQQASEKVTKPIVSKEENVTLTHGEEMKKYNVIVGSFTNVDNAIKLRNRLIGEGYKSIIMKNEQGMNRVSIASFDEEAPARAELARVRETYPEFSDAWLLIVKDK